MPTLEDVRRAMDGLLATADAALQALKAPPEPMQPDAKEPAPAEPPDEPDQLEIAAEALQQLQTPEGADESMRRSLGGDAIARLLLGVTLNRARAMGWRWGRPTFGEAARERHGISSSIAYEAMMIARTFCPPDQPPVASAEIVRKLGVRKMALLAARAERDGWDRAEIVRRCAEATEKSVRELAAEFRGPGNVVQLRPPE